MNIYTPYIKMRAREIAIDERRRNTLLWQLREYREYVYAREACSHILSLMKDTATLTDTQALIREWLSYAEDQS